MKIDKRTVGQAPAKPALDPLCEADFTPYCECEERLTDAQMDAICNMGYYRALLLKRERKWSPEEEAAFINGLACCFFATKCNEKVPAFWYLGPKGLLDMLQSFKDNGVLHQRRARKGRRHAQG